MSELGRRRESTRGEAAHRLPPHAQWLLRRSATTVPVHAPHAQTVCDVPRMCVNKPHYVGFLSAPAHGAESRSPPAARCAGRGRRTGGGAAGGHAQPTASDPRFDVKNVEGLMELSGHAGATASSRARSTPLPAPQTSPSAHTSSHPSPPATNAAAAAHTFPSLPPLMRQEASTHVRRGSTPRPDVGRSAPIHARHPIPKSVTHLPSQVSLPMPVSRQKLCFVIRAPNDRTEAHRTA